MSIKMKNHKSVTVTTCRTINYLARIIMNKNRLLEHLREQEPEKLIELLDVSFR